MHLPKTIKILSKYAPNILGYNDFSKDLLTLPSDVLIHSLTFLESKDLAITCCTSKTFSFGIRHLGRETKWNKGHVQIACEIRAKLYLPVELQPKRRSRRNGSLESWSKWLDNIEYMSIMKYRQHNHLALPHTDYNKIRISLDSHEEYLSSAFVLSANGIWDFKTDFLVEHGENTTLNFLYSNSVYLDKEDKFVQISIQGQTSMALSLKGRVFSWGEGYSGQLGHGDSLSEQQPKEIVALRGKQVVQIAASEHFSMALTAKGEVYTWGSAVFGALGYDSCNEQHIPRIVEALCKQNIVQIAAGFRHSMALTSDGVLFSWGDGFDGRLGHGYVQNTDVPVVIESLRNENIIQISAGIAHSMALTGDGTLYTWGDGEKGNLGHGDFEFQFVPKKVNLNYLKNIVQISAGSSHSFAVAADGIVYSWGDGSCGELGHGICDIQTLPKQIVALKGIHIVEVCAGNRQSLVRTKDGDILHFGVSLYDQSFEYFLLPERLNLR
eukprot:GSMAST32.ASY1.ANO1.2805.1 assembled CDS